MYYTYILLCFNDKKTYKLYIGSTSDLKNRFLEHKSKSVETTKSYTHINLIYYEACLSKKDSRLRELQLKTGFGRGFIKRRLKNYFTSRD